MWTALGADRGRCQRRKRWGKKQRGQLELEEGEGGPWELNGSILLGRRACGSRVKEGGQPGQRRQRVRGPNKVGSRLEGGLVRFGELGLRVPVNRAVLRPDSSSAAKLTSMSLSLWWVYTVRRAGKQQSIKAIHTDAPSLPHTQPTALGGSHPSRVLKMMRPPD